LSTVDRPERHRIRVLYVDDEPDQIEFVKRFLEMEDPGLHVDTALSATEALQKLREPYDCVISDYVMPDMDGLELCRRIREMRRVPFILYTGQGSEEVAEAAFAAGVDDYIRKEIDPSHYTVLVRRVKAAVEKHRAENLIRYLNQALRAIRSINQLITKERDRNRLLQQVCDLLITTSSYLATWIILMEGDGEAVFASNPEIVDPLNRIVELMRGGNPPACVRTALEHPGVNIIPSHKDFCANCPLEGKIPDGAILTRQLAYGDKVYGILTVVVPPIMVGEEERDLFNEVAGDISYALYAIELNEERKRMEEELRASERKFRVLAENAGDILAIIDLDGRFTYLSKGTIPKAGYTADDLLGKDMRDILLPESAKIASQRLRRFKKGARSLPPYTVWVKAKSGASVPFEINSSPILRDGELVGVQIIARDVSERIRYQTRLEALHRHASSLSIVETFEEVVKSTLDAMEDALGFEFIAFLIVEDNKLRTVGIRGAPLLGLSLPLDGKGITVKTARERRTVRVNDLRGDPDFVRGSTDSLSELAVPVIVDGEVIAVLNVESLQLDAFTDEDQKLLEILAQHVASALTRLKQTEQLKVSERRYASLLEASMDAIFVIQGTKYVYVNQAAVELLGYNHPSELIGKDAMQFVAPEDRDEIRKITLGRQRGEPKPGRYEAQLLKKDGTRVDVEMHVSLIEFEDKPASLAFIRDVTSRKRYEQRLEVLHRYAAELAGAETVEAVAELTFNAIEQVLGFNMGSFAIVEGDLLRHILIKGVETDEVLEMPLDGPGITVRAVRTSATQLILDTRKDKDFVPGFAEDAYQTLSELAVPVKIDSEVVAIINIESTKLNAFTEADKRLLEIFAGHVSSTINRIRLLEAKEIQAAKIAALHESASKLAYVKNRKEAFNATLDSLRSVLGFQWAGISVVEGGVARYVAYIGVELPKDWVIPLDQPSITARVVRTGRSQLIHDVRLDPEYIHAPIEGREEPPFLSELAVPVKVDDKVVAVINVEKKTVAAFTEDDRRLVEILAEHLASALSRLRRVDELERLVDERTRDLLDAERMAAAGSVASMVGHDLRGPLQTIKNAVYLIRRAPEEMEELLKTIDNAVEYAAQMLEEIRHRTRESPLKTEPVDLAGLIRKAADDAALPPPIELILSLGEGLESISLDPMKIRRVLDNLIRNAVEAMLQGGSLTLSAEKRKDHIVIKVRDTGKGIPKEILPNLFKPFHTTKPKGTGLGLAYCKRAVEAHGGTITAESREGEGTTFIITLPVKRSQVNSKH